MYQAHPIDDQTMQAHRIDFLAASLGTHLCDNPDCDAASEDEHIEPIRCTYCGRPESDCDAAIDWTIDRD